MQITRERCMEIRDKRPNAFFSEPNDIIVIANVIMFHRDILGKHFR